MPSFPSVLVRLTAGLLLAASLSLFGGCTSAMEDELVIEDLRVGDGARAEGDVYVTVHYDGFLRSGFQFDSSHKIGGAPIVFHLTTGRIASLEGGDKKVITGFIEGLPGMRVGGLRRLTIPPHLAYGRNGVASRNIPANATLTYDVSLEAVQTAQELAASR